MKKQSKCSFNLSTTARLFLPVFVFLTIFVPFVQSQTTEGVWKLVGYTFKDGSRSGESYLAGTTSKMFDKVSFIGKQGDITISHNRTDIQTKKQLAECTYRVVWSDPPDVLIAGEKASMNYKLEILSSFNKWKPQQQSVYLNQGLNGVYFASADGTNYFTSDINTSLVTQKVIEKGTKGNIRTIQVMLGEGFVATYTYEWMAEGNVKAVASQGAGWHFTGYTFKDGTRSGESFLAGTTSKMFDNVSFSGKQGDITISHNRTDVQTKKQLAECTYRVVWSDPPEILITGEKASMNYKMEVLSSFNKWKPQQQSVYLNQGLNGVYFATADGTKYFTNEMNTSLVTQKLIEKGAKGNTRTIQVVLGEGFVATYNYEWRD